MGNILSWFFGSSTSKTSGKNFTESSDRLALPLSHTADNTLQLWEDVYNECLQFLLRENNESLSVIKQRLLQDKRNYCKYKNAWSLSRRFFRSNCKSTVLNHYYQRRPDIIHIAFTCYTAEQPNVYLEFNQALREIDGHYSASNFRYLSLWSLLLYGIKTLKRSGPPSSVPVDCKLYRGVHGIVLSATVGQEVGFKEYLSTSHDINVAKSFISYSGSTSCTMIVITGWCQYGMCLRLHAQHPVEGEVLIAPLQKFRVTKVERYEFNQATGNCIYLKPVNDSSNLGRKAFCANSDCSMTDDSD